jgi:hypothetical protein
LFQTQIQYLKNFFFLEKKDACKQAVLIITKKNKNPQTIKTKNEELVFEKN